MQKSKKKKKRKIFNGTFSLAVFLFPVTKRAEKVSGFVFFRERRGKMLNKLEKKKFFIRSFSELFHYFWSLGSRKR